MPLNFPNNPTIGQQSVQNGRTYQWDGYAWNFINNISNHASTHSVNGSDPISINTSQISNFASGVNNILSGSGFSGYISKFTASGITTSNIFESSGNIGINTLNPLAALHIVNSGSTRTLIEVNANGLISPLNLYNSSSASDAGAGMLFSASGTTSFIGGMASVRTSNNNSITFLRAMSSGVISLPSIDSAPLSVLGTGSGYNTIINGRLGINNTNPASSVDVSGLITSNSGNFTQNLQIGTNNLTNTNTMNIINSSNLYLWSNFR